MQFEEIVKILFANCFMMMIVLQMQPFCSSLGWKVFIIDRRWWKKPLFFTGGWLWFPKCLKRGCVCLPAFHKRFLSINFPEIFNFLSLHHFCWGGPHRKIPTLFEFLFIFCCSLSNVLTVFTLHWNILLNSLYFCTFTRL